MRIHRTRGEMEERAHIQTPWHVCNIQWEAMFYLKTREAQQSVALDSWKHPERKEQENVGDDCERGDTLTPGNLNGLNFSLICSEFDLNNVENTHHSLFREQNDVSDSGEVDDLEILTITPTSCPSHT